MTTIKTAKGKTVMEHQLQPTPGGNDLLAGLQVDLPDIRNHQKILENLIKMKEQRDKDQQQRELNRAHFAKQAAERAQHTSAQDTALNQMAALKEQLTMVRAQEFLEDEQVLFPITPTEPDLDVDPDFVQAATWGLKELGLEDIYEQLGGRDMGLEAFKRHVLSGFLAPELLKSGKCSAIASNALFTLLAYSADVQLGGAAFTTLLLAMGDDVIGHMCLDAVAGAEAPCSSHVTLEGLPRDTDIIEALKANGFNAKGGKGGKGVGKKKEQQQKDVGQETELRVQTIKLLLHTAAALCRYHSKHQASPVAQSSISREGISELIAATLHMGIDPSAVRLQEELDTVLPILLSVLSDDDWQRVLPLLAERVASMGPTAKAHLRVLKFIPAEHPRGFELQQLAGCLLLERIIPAKGGAQAKSAVGRRGALPNPGDVISVQSWFDDGKKLINGATSGGAGAAPRGGYLIGHVELLLMTCHTVLWPHMLKHGMGKGWSRSGFGALTDAFLDDWVAFLATVAKHIKALQAEDQFVRGLACQLEMEYRNLRQLAEERGAPGITSP